MFKFLNQKTSKGASQKCTKCKGSGRVPVSLKNGSDTETCTKCDGLGYTERVPEYV